jgi:hypothetical protein
LRADDEFSCPEDEDKISYKTVTSCVTSESEGRINIKDFMETKEKRREKRKGDLQRTEDKKNK